MYQHVWFRLIICKESPIILQYSQLVSETCVQCVRHSDPRHTANDVSVIRWCDQSSVMAVRVTSARSPASTNQRYQTSCRRKLVQSFLHDSYVCMYVCMLIEFILLLCHTGATDTGDIKGCLTWLDYSCCGTHVPLNASNILTPQVRDIVLRNVR